MYFNLMYLTKFSTLYTLGKIEITRENYFKLV